MDRSRPGRSTSRKVAVAAAFVLHAGVGVFPYGASGLLAPPAGVAVLYAVWVSLLAVAVVLLRRGRSVELLAVPAAALALWFALVSLGGSVLGWTA